MQTTLSYSFRVVIVLLASFAVAIGVSIIAGPRFGLIILIGTAFGATLEGLRFGFAGPWRQMILARNPAGVFAQLACIAMVAVVAFPLLESHPEELIGAHAPVGVAMVGGAFVFGVCMQLLLGCGSGTLVNAGSGNAIAVVSLPFFAVGSFAGATHLDSWVSLGSLPLMTLSGASGLAITLVGLAVVAGLAWIYASQSQRSVPLRLWVAAGLIAALAVLHLVVAGQPWGVVFGLGLWVAKGIAAAGGDLGGSVFWVGQQVRLEQSLFTDVTSLTNIGLVSGAAIITWLRSGFDQLLQPLPVRGWVSVVIVGFLLGYSSRLAFGCNVGAFFSGISTGSFHGWVWLVFAFAGAWVGVKLRPNLGLEPR